MNTINTQGNDDLKPSVSQSAEQAGRMGQTKTALDFDRWELDDLIDYILNTHHYFVWVNLPVIKEFALKTARHKGEYCPQAIEVNRQFKELASGIEDHLQTQEYSVFPSIKKLVFANRDGREVHADNLESLVDNIKAEHKFFSKKLHLIVSLLSDTESTKQPDSLPMALLDKLAAFEKDFNQYTKLERSVLFPKALELEQVTRN